MATTPEGRVKKLVKAQLNALKPNLWYFMPVPTGFGVTTVDFIGWYKGRAFAIETKAAGSSPTKLQEAVMDDMGLAGGTMFVVRSEDDMAAFHHWTTLVDGE